MGPLEGIVKAFLFLGGLKLYNELTKDTDTDTILDFGIWCASGNSAVPTSDGRWPTDGSGNTEESGFLLSLKYFVFYYQIVITRGGVVEGNGNGNIYIRKKYNQIRWGKWYLLSTTMRQ